MPKISRSKDNQTMKLDELINEINQEKYFSSKIILKMRQGD